MALLTLTVRSKNGEPVTSYSQVFESTKMYDIIANTNKTGGSTQSYPILEGATMFSIETIDGAFDNYTVTEEFTSIVTAADGTIKKAEVTLTSAQILAMNTTPIDIVAAPGAGKAILPISGYVFLNATSTTYTTNLDVDIVHSGAATTAFMSSEDALNGTADKYTVLRPFALGTTAYPLVANESLQVTDVAGAPGAGTGIITVVIYYQEVTLVT